MICHRNGCKKLVAQDRRRYCSAECAEAQVRADAAARSRVRRARRLKERQALQPQAKRRPCLRCDRMFASAHYGNRICPACLAEMPTVVPNRFW